MSEQPEREPTVDRVTTPDVAPGLAAPRTGHEQVDAALGSLEGLDELPVDEHVAVLEQAHASLRDALSRPVEPA
ncbi:hypothetical protein [Nocardioides caldifontis]|uniref:hypothetical protein n=1 Tax=Nocardioides caldifontis TaxID=2588938 RepID=UPI00193A34E1|nr:hypothetical protein [Nocardioides caldifontis]